MTRFVSPDFPQQHGGLVRMGRGLSTIRSFASPTRSAKGLASILVAGGIAAAIVVANQIVTAWADGHLLLAWIAMWVIVFTLLALFSDSIRTWPARLHASKAPTPMAPAAQRMTGGFRATPLPGLPTHMRYSTS